MKLDGHKRLDVFVPEELWDRMEEARGEVSRSEWVRARIVEHLAYAKLSGRIPSRSEARDEAITDPAIAEELAHRKLKTAREILQERTRAMRNE